MNIEPFKNVKAIFFDVGDTLYVNEELEKQYPKQLVKLLSDSKGIGLDEAKQLLNDTTEALQATEKHVTKVRAMKELGYTRAQVHEAFCKVDPKQFLSQDPELKSVISRLAQRYQLGIISNFKKVHLLETLSALGLEEGQFPLMVTEDIVQEIKPAPEPFLKAIELAGGSAEESVYVGDSPSKDIRPAKEQGMLTILVKRDPSAEDLKNADACIGNITELEELI